MASSLESQKLQNVQVQVRSSMVLHGTVMHSMACCSKEKMVHYMRTRTQIQTDICIYTCIYAYIHACMHACMHAHIHIYIYVYTYLLTRVNNCVCVRDLIGFEGLATELRDSGSCLARASAQMKSKGLSKLAESCCTCQAVSYSPYVMSGA